MDVKKISSDLSVSPQIQVSDLVRLYELGIRSIINNRPDFEGDDQPLSADLAAEAGRLGLDYRHIPVIPGQLSESTIDEFSQAMLELQAPMFAYCRSGMRSTTLWALDSAVRIDVDTILKSAAAAGFDLSELQPRLLAIAAAAAENENQ